MNRHERRIQAVLNRKKPKLAQEAKLEQMIPDIPQKGLVLLPPISQGHDKFKLEALVCYTWIFQKYEIPDEWLNENLKPNVCGRIFCDGMYYDGIHFNKLPPEQNDGKPLLLVVSVEKPDGTTFPFENIANTIIHEATHIHQIYRGDLDCTDDFQRDIWKGKIWEEERQLKELTLAKHLYGESTYDDRPWEKEANENAEKYTKEFMENKEQILDEFKEKHLKSPTS